MSRQENFYVGLLNRTVLIYNVVTCDDAKNDAEGTIKGLVSRLEYDRDPVTRKMLEAALYCSNINHEDDKFWHPYKKSFRTFVQELAEDMWWFDEYYNLIRNVDEKKETKNGRVTKARG